jgi:phosphatidylglycerophosphate synthase
MTNTAVISQLGNNGFRDAKRVQESILSGIEKRALIWLSKRMPARVTPDHLTAVGFAAMIAAGGCYAASQWWPSALLLVNALLAVNWFGDSMDGTLARFRNKQRPRYGYYVDHIIDALSAVFLFGGLALSGLMSAPVAVGMLLCYLLLAIQSYLATHSLGVFSISWWKFSPTEMRILLAMGNTVVYFKPVIAPAGWHILFFDLAGVISIVCMLGVLSASVVRNTILLYRAERV